MFWNRPSEPRPRTWTPVLTTERVMQLRGQPGSPPWVAAHQLWEPTGGLFQAVKANPGWRGLATTQDGVWATGTGGKSARLHEGAWTFDRFQGHDGISIAAWGDHAWVPVALGEINRFDGQSWSVWSPPALSDRNTGVIWGASETDVWLQATPRSSGIPPELGHWDGTEWTFTALSTKGYISGLHGTASDDVWAVGWTVKLLGKGPLLAHWDGTRWTEVDLPVDGKLYDVVAVSKDEVWAVGESIVLRGLHANQEWVFEPQQAPAEAVVSVWATRHAVWIATNTTISQSPLEHE